MMFLPFTRILPHYNLAEIKDVPRPLTVHTSEAGTGFVHSELPHFPVNIPTFPVNFLNTPFLFFSLRRIFFPRCLFGRQMLHPFTTRVRDLKKGPCTNENTRQEV